MFIKTVIFKKNFFTQTISGPVTDDWLLTREWDMCTVNILAILEPDI